MSETRNRSAKDDLGEKPVGPLLLKLAVPAIVGIFAVVVYNVVDTIFVGRWVGGLGIAAIGVVSPIGMLIATLGMSVGVGSASIISRAFGRDDSKTACQTFGTAISLTVSLSLIAVVLGYVFEEPVLRAFGAKGDIYPTAKEYYDIILLGLPLLAFAMMSNNVMRAEGEAKVAMMTMVIPGVINIALDPIFIKVLDLGVAGSAWATIIAYASSALFSIWYFASGRSSVLFIPAFLKPSMAITREIFAIGITTWARQGSASLLALVVNNVLFTHGGELAVTSFTIVGRMLMVAFIPLFGLTQGFLPVTGYNFGAQAWERVRDSLRISLVSAAAISTLLFVLLELCARPIVLLFTSDAELVEATIRPFRVIFLGTPVVGIQLLGAAYYQAIGKAIPALVLTLTRQSLFLIPLVLILAPIYGLDGVWFAFPVAEVMAMLLTMGFLIPQLRQLNRKIPQTV